MQEPRLACGVRTRSGWERPAIGLLGVLAVLALGASPALARPTDRALIDEYAGIEGAHLGESLPGGPEHFITVIDSPKFVQIVHEYGKTYTAGAVTELGWNSSGSELIGAKITVYGIARSESEALVRGSIAHEVFHAYEGRMSGTETVNDAHGGWLIEGAAEWVESELVPNDRTARHDWTEYLKAPGTALFKRAYDGVGFFGHMVASHINPWTHFKNMFATTSSPAAYTAAGVGKTFLDNEASVFFRDAALGSEWDQKGRNVPTAGAVHFKPVKVTATASTMEQLVVPAYADGAYELDIHGLPVTKPVLEVTLVKGNARLRSTSGGSVDEVDQGQVLLCADPKGCSCPKRPNNYPKFVRGDLALTGGPGGGEVELVARAPCEVLLPGSSCLTLLPGFGQLISSVASKPTAIETRQPDGTTDSACAFLYKGVEMTGLEGEKEFVGAIAPVVNVLRASTIGGAIRVFQALTAGQSGARPKIGDEAVLLTRETPGAKGLEYGSSAIVRVLNVVANYALISTPGNTEADPTQSLALLALVASKL